MASDCDCGEWPGPCDGTGWCKLEKKDDSE